MIGELDTSNWITILGWGVAFFLGIVAKIISDYVARKRRILAWGVIEEADFVASSISEQLRVPVKLLVGGEPQDRLTTLTVRVANIGNEVIENFNVAIRLNQGCKVLKEASPAEFGQFGNHCHIATMDPPRTIRFDFLNPAQELDFVFVLSGYEPGSCDLGVAAPGVRLLRRRTAGWEIPKTLLGSIALNFFGVRYEPNVSALHEIARELKALRSRRSL